VHSFEADVRKRLINHPYKKQVEEAIIRYVRALDARNFHVAYVKLWGVLETLTDTTRLANEVTIRRASFLYEDKDFQRQVLRHLVHYRNQTVHVGKETTWIQTMLYQLKRYVERLLTFPIHNFHQFETIAEVAEFLDLPVELAVRQKKMRLYKRALKFRYDS
jgi:hypothetical protein